MFTDTTGPISVQPYPSNRSRPYFSLKPSAKGARNFSAPTMTYRREENSSAVHLLRYAAQNVGVLIRSVALYRLTISPTVFASSGLGWYTAANADTRGNHRVPVNPKVWKNGRTPMSLSFPVS